MAAQAEPRRDAEAFDRTANVSEETPGGNVGAAESAELICTLDGVIQRGKLACGARAARPAVFAASATRIDDAVELLVEQIKIDADRQEEGAPGSQVEATEGFAGRSWIVEQARIDEDGLCREATEDEDIVSIFKQGSVEGAAKVRGIAHGEPARGTKPKLLAAEAQGRRARARRQDQIAEGLAQIWRALVIGPLDRTARLCGRIELHEGAEIFRKMQIVVQEHAFLVGAEGLSVRRQAEQIGIVAVIAVAQFSAEAEIVRGRVAEVDVLEALVVAEWLGLAREPEIILLPAVEPEADLLLRPGVIASRLLRLQRFEASKEHSHGAYSDGERCNSAQPISTAPADRKTTEGAPEIAPDRERRVLSLKPALRLEWCGQDGQYETKQRDHVVLRLVYSFC